MFDHSCNFRINATGIDPEEIELEFIDFGVEEVFVDDDGMLLYASFESFGEVQKELEKEHLKSFRLALNVFLNLLNLLI